MILLFVVVALLLVSNVIVPDEVVRSVMFPLVMVVVANVLVPTTVRVLLAVKDDVAVISPPVIVPPVKLVTTAVTAFKRVAKKLDDVAFNSVAEVAATVLNVEELA